MGLLKQVLAVGLVAIIFGIWQVSSSLEIEPRGHFTSADVLRIRMINVLLTHVPVSVLGYLTTLLSLKQAAFLGGVNGKDLSNFNTELAVEGIDAGNVRWFTEVSDRQPEDPVLVLCHGGGYALGMSSYYATMLNVLYKRVNDPRLSIVWFDYKTTTQAPFPSQINEGIMVYDTLSKTSKNIILMGDSAGGHMALNIIKHIHEPIEGFHKLSTDLKPTAVILISPSMGFDRNYSGSMEEFDGKDIINYKVAIGMSDLVRRGQSKIATVNPAKVPTIWKEIIPDYSKVFISYGEQEMLRDSIVKWLEESGLNDGARVYKDPTGMHTGLLHAATRSTGLIELAKFINEVNSK